MEIVAAVLGAIVAVLAGAWINNVFTWKVKNRVEALDRIYIDVLEYNQAFLDFCKKQLAKNRDRTIEAIARNSSETKHLETASNNMVTTPYTDKNLIEELNQQINPYIHRGFRDTYIIDGRKSGSLYKKILDWSVFIANNASKYSAFVRPKGIPIGPTAQQYEELLNDVTDTIFNQRKEITSFPYMLKQLFCNCGVALVTLFILAIVYSATVQAENTLLVGTTGDYPPLTYKVGANYVGSDIKVIQNFAKSNNMALLKFKWVTIYSK